MHPYFTFCFPALKKVSPGVLKINTALQIAGLNKPRDTAMIAALEKGYDITDVAETS